MNSRDTTFGGARRGLRRQGEQRTAKRVDAMSARREEHGAPGGQGSRRSAGHRAIEAEDRRDSPDRRRLRPHAPVMGRLIAPTHTLGALAWPDKHFWTIVRNVLGGAERGGKEGKGRLVLRM